MQIKHLAIAAISVSISSLGWAGEPAFSLGNQFENAQISGGVSLMCYPSNNNPTTGPMPINHFVSCQKDTLAPADHDRLIARVEADKVILTAVHEDGSTRTKDLSFDSIKGRSESVNLWVQSLFSKPLLKAGTNKIHYQFKWKNISVQEGDFIVTVNRAEDRRCALGNYPGYMNNCSDSYSVCEGYFQQNNYCR